MLITVTEMDPPDGNTVTVGYGIEVDTDRRIRFACDWRPASAIFDAISQGEDVEVELESWQILGGN